MYFLSHLISFYTWNAEIKHEKGYFLFKKLKTILNRIRKHALFGRKFLTFAHVPRLEKLYLWPAVKFSATKSNCTKFKSYEPELILSSSLANINVHQELSDHYLEVKVEMRTVQLHFVISIGIIRAVKSKNTTLGVCCLSSLLQINIKASSILSQFVYGYWAKTLDIILPSELEWSIIERAIAS